jgi:ketosteroid isomerase-like protein
MRFFTDDAVLDMPRGPHPWGRRLQGREEVRSGLASRLAGLPDVHYGEDRHWVSGDRGCSEWLLTGTTTPQGERVEVRGCDLFEFKGDKIARKDSYWKLVEHTSVSVASARASPAKHPRRKSRAIPAVSSIVPSCVQRGF